MKKTKSIMTCLLCSMVLPLMVSCGPNIDEFKKDIAIKQMRDQNYNLIKNRFSTEMTYSYGSDFLYDNYNKEYTSVYNNKSFYCNKLSYKLVGSTKYYYENDRIYDIFGDFTYLNYNFDSYQVQKKRYILASERSNFYQEISGINMDEAEDKIHVIEQNVFLLDESYYGDYEFSVFKEVGDTNYKVRSILKRSQYEYLEGFQDYYYVENINNVIRFNDKEYRLVLEREDEDPLIYSASLKEGRIDYQLIYDNQEQVGKTLLNIDFEDGYSFKYNIEPLKSQYDNDYTYFENGIKYKVHSYVRGVEKNMHVDFVPYSYVINKDSNKACLLVKKIIDDQGNLSNKFYTMTITKDGTTSGLSEDTSLFTNENSMFIYQGRLIELKPEERLLILKDNYYVKIDENGYIYVDGSNDYRTIIEDIDTFRYVTKSAVSHKYVFADKRAEYVFDESTLSFDVNFISGTEYVSSDLAIRIEDKEPNYANRREIYMLGNIFDSCYDYKIDRKSATIFGESNFATVLLTKSYEDSSSYDNNYILLLEESNY